MEKLCDLLMATVLNSYKVEFESSSAWLQTQAFSATGHWKINLCGKMSSSNKVG